jgi:hypothetical protein
MTVVLRVNAAMDSLRLLFSGCADSLKRSSTRKQIEDENDNGKNYQNVYPASQRVTADQAENPKNDENNRDRPKHD